MVTVNLEHRARELLAAEYERDGRPSDADFTSGGLPVCDADIRALRAIEAALAQQPAAAAAADETVVPVAQVLRGGHGVAHDTLYVGLIPRGPATPEVKEGDLLYLAQQPAAVVDEAAH